jgi:hypothetical protein
MVGLEWLTPKLKHLDNGVTGCNETMQRVDYRFGRATENEITRSIH